MMGPYLGLRWLRSSVLLSGLAIGLAAASGPAGAEAEPDAAGAAPAGDTSFDLSETDLRYYQAWGISREDAEFNYQIVQAQDAVARGSLKKSLAYLERALELRPDSIGAHHAYGMALVQFGRPKRAVPHFERVIGTGSDLEASSHTHLGRILGAMGRGTEAMAHFERAAELNPERAEVRYNLGLSYYRNERYPDAAVELERATELDPTSARYHHRLAGAYMKLGRHAEAIDRLETVLRIKGYDPAAEYEIGLAHEALGNEALARASFEQALASSKQSTRYRALQRRLEKRLATRSRP